MTADLQVMATEPLTDQEEQTVYRPTETWTDAFAAKIAIQDFQKAEAYRSANQDWRWRTSDELYQSWVVQKYWDGSKIPRASIGVFVAFEQIESMLPKIMSALFADTPWFQADPLFGTSAADAGKWRTLIEHQLEQTHVREVYRRCIKSALLYGNGIAKLSWDLREEDRLEWLVRMNAKPGGGFQRVLDKKTRKRIINRPVLEYVSIKDFYIDPNCASPQPQDARYRARRKLVSVDDLDLLRGIAPYQIPSTDRLLDWARHKPSAQADNTKGAAELFRLGFWMPSEDQTADPGGLLIEVIEYETDSRLVWVANREQAILNIPNTYGFSTYYGTFYADVLDRFYAMSVCDVVEGEQRLQNALLNGRLDELALSLHRPMVKKIGIKTPTYSLRARPGQMWEAEHPKDDYVFLDVPNITANAYIETNASELRVQKNTGQADLYSMGTPTSGGNSASRTATGIGAQVQASGSRVQYLVENIEDSFIEPMLNDIVSLNQMFPPIGTSYADTVALSKVQLSMRASAKMASRSGLLQSFPLMFQAMTNPGFVGELASTGMTPDWVELFRALSDMTGWRARADLIRKLSPEEMQQRNQPPQQDLLKMQMQRERIQGQSQIQAQRLQTESGLEQQRMASQDQTDDNAMLAELVKAIMPILKKQGEAMRSE